MILRPCLRCHRKTGCARREEMVRKLRGSGVTTASFKCPERMVGLEPGRRVTVRLFNIVVGERPGGPDYEPEPIIGEAAVPGTVICPSRKSPWKVVVRLDREATERWGIEKQYVKVWPDNCRPDEEMRALCPLSECRHPVDDDGKCHRDDWHEELARRDQDAGIPW